MSPRGVAGPEAQANLLKRALAHAVERREQARWQLNQAEQTIRETLPKAREAGVSAIELGKVLGISRQRVHQLLDGHRDF